MADEKELEKPTRNDSPASNAERSSAGRQSVAGGDKVNLVKLSQIIKSLT